MKYKFFYDISDLTDDSGKYHEIYRYFHRVSCDEVAIRKAEEWIQKERRRSRREWSFTGFYSVRLMRVVKSRTKKEEKIHGKKRKF